MSIQPGQVTPAIPELESYVQTAPDLTRENLLDVEEVARRLNVSPQWVRDHATRRHPKLPCVRLGSLMRFRPSAVDEFIEQQSHAAPWRRRRAKAS
jgi:excisionase family DNA binding protein